MVVAVAAAMVLVVAGAVAETVGRAVAVVATKVRVVEVGMVGRAVAVVVIKARVAAVDAVGTRVRAAAVGMEVAVAEDEEIAAGVALSAPAAVEGHPPGKDMTYPQRKLLIELGQYDYNVLLTQQAGSPSLPRP